MAGLVLREESTSTATEDFKKNRMLGKRYVDKTALLAPLLDVDHETTFFLRPRRFGKTLTLSMIQYFVEDTRDPELNEENRSLFRGLRIMEMGEKYTGQMTSFPVIHLTMQTVSGMNYREAFQELKDLVQREYDKNRYLLKSNRLSELEKSDFQRVLYGKDDTGRKADIADYKKSLKNLTAFLQKDSGKRAVVLIDEYDVPLEKAYQNGYYKEMVGLIGPLLQNVLKTNSENLQFAVVTGCLRIAKEGIYTGLNNPEISTVTSVRNGDTIGFTETEVQKLMADSGVADSFSDAKEWYDGYRFGSAVIYNPWSVINFIEDRAVEPQCCPRLYWAGTSGNSIVRELAEHADEETRAKAEKLVQGGEITFAQKDDIVYDDLFSDPDNVFNVMLAAGYLTAVSVDGKLIRARIPNKEVHGIFTDKFAQWFKASIRTFNIQELYAAMENGEVKKIQKILNRRFFETMSYYDTVEAFYHGVMLALMQLSHDYSCVSNRESGSGRFDLQCKRIIDRDMAFILEFKVSKSMDDLDADAQAAVDQIEEKGYVTELRRERYEKIMTYGFAFCGKYCVVVQGKIYTAKE